MAKPAVRTQVTLLLFGVITDLIVGSLTASSLQHFWDPCIFSCRTKSLEFTAWSSAGSSCWPHIRSISAL